VCEKYTKKYFVLFVCLIGKWAAEQKSDNVSFVEKNNSWTKKILKLH